MTGVKGTRQVERSYLPLPRETSAVRFRSRRVAGHVKRLNEVEGPPNLCESESSTMYYSVIIVPLPLVQGANEAGTKIASDPLRSNHSKTRLSVELPPTYIFVSGGSFRIIIDV